jgi:hypothetical protein
MRNRPTRKELRDAVAAFRNTADPAAASHAFYSRVADNVDALIEREETLGPDFDAAEQTRLAAILGETGSLIDLNRALAVAIRTAALVIDDPSLRDHLRLTARESLAIDNPHYASYRRDIGDV